MKKNLLLYILLIFLIVVNCFFLYNYIGKPEMKGHRGGPKGPPEFIAKQLDLDDSQFNKFDELSNTHRKNMRSISDEIRGLKRVLFEDVFKEGSERKIDSMTTLIGNNEKEKELEIINYFKNIESICTEKQKKHFNEIMRDALRHGGKKGDRPPR